MQKYDEMDVVRAVEIVKDIWSRIKELISNISETAKEDPKLARKLIIEMELDTGTTLELLDLVSYYENERTIEEYVNKLRG